jgi:MYXO-CTERM domain-containing protein
VYGFYVAGARQTPPECRGGSEDPTGTEHWVTYNEGLSGDALEQSRIGWVDPGNYANRGCMSQNGSHCLSTAGRSWDQILRFYYGSDIEIVRAEGECVTATGIDAGADSTPDDAGASSDGGRIDHVDAGQTATPLPTVDASGTPPRAPGSSALQGSCAVAPPGSPSGVIVIVAVVAAATRRRRRATTRPTAASAGTCTRP